LSTLKYKLTNDILFKCLFVQRQDLLKRLVSKLLPIPFENIQEFTVINSEIPPETIGDKLCRLDINMKIDNHLVDLEIQVDNNEHDFKERSLYYWSRDYSTALKKGMAYSELPTVIFIGILDFPLFDCQEFHSEFRPLEVTRHTLLTDRMSLQYYELPKFKKKLNPDDELNLWLSLFKAETTEDLEAIKNTGVIMLQEAVETYHKVQTTEQFEALQRARHFAEMNTQSALSHARKEGIQEGRQEGYREAEATYQHQLADYQHQLVDKDALIAELQARLQTKESTNH